MQQLRHFQKETENSIIPETLLMAILLYFIMLLYFVSYYLYSNVYGFTLYVIYYAATPLIGIYFSDTGV